MPVEGRLLPVPGGQTNDPFRREGVSRPVATSSLAADGTILTTVHIVRRITADRPSVDDRGAFSIQPEPAAAILRRYGGQSRRAPGDCRDRSVAESAEA
jgi:hypothetical protein